MCGDAVYIISEESRLEECLEEDASVVSGVLEADFLLLEAVVVMVRSWWCWCPLYRREHCCRSLQVLCIGNCNFTFFVVLKRTIIVKYIL